MNKPVGFLDTSDTFLVCETKHWKEGHVAQLVLECFPSMCETPQGGVAHAVSSRL